MTEPRARAGMDSKIQLLQEKKGNIKDTGKFCGTSGERKKTKFKQKCENGRNGRKV